MSCGQQITIKRPNHQHLHTDVTDFDAAVNDVINITVLNSASADWSSVYTTVNDLSSTWDYQGNDIKSLSANWQNTYTTVQNNSSIWSLTASQIDTTAFYPATGGLLSGSLLTHTFVSANSADLNVLKFSVGTAPSWEEGRVFYDEPTHTLSYYNDHLDMTVNLGQEHIVRVYNGESQTINNGQVVYVDGSHGNTPRVFLANASYTDMTTDKIIGVATTDILATGNRIGYVTIAGIVHDIPVGSTVYTEGDNVWLSLIDGELTNTPPEKPNHIVDLGVVIGTAGGGSNHRIDLLVKINNKSKLSDLHDTVLSNLSSNDILRYNPTSGGYWYNANTNIWDTTTTVVQQNSASWVGGSGGVTVGLVIGLGSINIV